MRMRHKRYGGIALFKGLALTDGRRIVWAYDDQQGELPTNRLATMHLAYLFFRKIFAELYPLERVITIVLIVLFNLLLIIGYLSPTPRVGTGIFFYVVLGLLLLNFITLHLNPAARLLLRYHAAEHMVIHTLDKRLPLTLENVRNQPMLHPRCGSGLIWLFLLVLLWRALSPSLWSSALILSAVISVALALFRLAGLPKPLLFTQRLFVAEPSDSELKLAITLATRIND